MTDKLLPPSHPSITLPHDALAQSPALSLPTLLLGYQKQPSIKMMTSAVVFVEKSRRVGITWGVASDAVLNAAASKMAGGMDVFYIGFNLDMTREFIDTCASWAKAFSHAASAVDEFVFKDDNEKEIKAFRITFDSGFEIVALTSRPRSLRGRQGYVIIDEAAFHDDLKELMKAALALLIWGGKVLVISTHDGVDNVFNQYIQDIKAGRLKYGLITIDFDDALKDGLYQRICLVKGDDWSQEKENKWRDEIIDFYGDGADEELFCIPRLSAGAYFPGTLVESRMVNVPVLRFSCDDDFVFRSDFDRQSIVKAWCEENLRPLLATLDPTLQHFFGEDFGRSGDLTTLFPIQLRQNLQRHVPFCVELRNVPFRQQIQIIWYVLDHLPRFMAACFDGRGNGQQVAEETMQRYGANSIRCVMITAGWYQEVMPKYKAALEDDMQTLPRDADILNDHRAARLVGGQPQIPNARTKGADGKQRHGDSLVGLLMGYYATLQEVVEYAYDSINKKTRANMMQPPVDDDVDRSAGGFGKNTGAW
jgi:phage FluMu gp28-like protein